MFFRAGVLSNLPIYEYECAACGHKFETLKHLINLDGKVKCPNCGGHKINRIFSAFTSKAGTGDLCKPGLPT
ncbi:zinc ribbon domain-containing protein [Chloroflexota bacterium]